MTNAPARCRVSTAPVLPRTPPLPSPATASQPRRPWLLAASRAVSRPAGLSAPAPVLALCTSGPQSPMPALYSNQPLLHARDAHGMTALYHKTCHGRARGVDYGTVLSSRARYTAPHRTAQYSHGKMCTPSPSLALPRSQRVGGARSVHARARTAPASTMYTAPPPSQTETPVSRAGFRASGHGLAR